MKMYFPPKVKKQWLATMQDHQDQDRFIQGEWSESSAYQRERDTLLAAQKNL